MSFTVRYQLRSYGEVTLNASDSAEALDLVQTLIENRADVLREHVYDHDSDITDVEVNPNPNVMEDVAVALEAHRRDVRDALRRMVDAADPHGNLPPQLAAELVTAVRAMLAASGG